MLALCGHPEKFKSEAKPRTLTDPRILGPASQGGGDD